MNKCGFLRKDCENTLNILGCPRDLFKETVKKTEKVSLSLFVFLYVPKNERHRVKKKE